MSKTSKHKVLVVDGDPIILDIMAGLLNTAGYEVSTAKNGFDALAQLRKMLPDIIISDLNMPQMSGFEFLSVVRRRFSTVPSVAVSGAYATGKGIPGGVAADAFYAKGQQHPEELLHTIAQLIQSASERPVRHQRQPAPVWIPRNGRNSQGVHFIVPTCQECLRSFPFKILGEGLQEIQETPCLFCAAPVRFIVDFSVAVVALKEQAVAANA